MIPQLKTIQPTIDIANAEVVTLRNGMKLYILSTPEFEVMRFTVLFRAGSARQQHPFTAASTVNLLAEGSERMTAHEISEQLDYHGSYFDVNTDRDYVYISFAMLSKFVPQTLAVAEEILLRPTFPEEEVETYRQKRKQRLAIERTKVDVRAREAFAKAMFGENHPYGLSYPESAYDELRREDLVAFYRTHYTASNGFAVCSGRVEEAEREALVALLEQLPEGEQPAPVLFPPIEQTREVRLHHEGAVQSSIRIGRRLFGREHPDFVGMQVVAAALGGYFGSRLMQNLRERNGFTYGVFSAMVNFQQTGYLAIATQVGTEVTERALEEIAAEIEILRTELIPDEELELVKNIMAGEMMRILDGPFGIADVTTENILCGFDNNQIQHNLERIRRTTPEELLSLAQKYLNPADITTVIAGDFNQ